MFVTCCGTEQCLGRKREFSGFEFLGLHPEFFRRVIMTLLLSISGCFVGRCWTAHFSQILDGADSRWTMTWYTITLPRWRAVSCLSQKVLGQGKWVSIEFKKKCISYILGPLDMKCISIFTVLSLKQLLKFHRLKRAAGMMQVETGGLCHGILHMLCYSISQEWGRPLRTDTIRFLGYFVKWNKQSCQAHKTK